MKITELLKEQPQMPSQNPNAPQGTNAGGRPTIQQAPRQPQTAQAQQTMDPVAQQKQKQDQRKQLDKQIKQVQDQIKMQQDQLKTLQQQKAMMK